MNDLTDFVGSFAEDYANKKLPSSVPNECTCAGQGVCSWCICVLEWLVADDQTRQQLDAELYQFATTLKEMKASA